MNMILFADLQESRFLPSRDQRVRHIKKILKSRPGEILKAGLAGGPRGWARIDSMNEQGITFHAEFPNPPEASVPLTLLLGTPRPPVAKRLIRDLTSLGVARIIWTASDLGEKTYFESKLWQDGGYRQALWEGAQQGMITLFPQMDRTYTVTAALELLEKVNPSIPSKSRWLLHPDPKAPILTEALDSTTPPLILALGPERGWSSRELELMESRHFRRSRLTPQILRTETAATGSALMALCRFSGRNSPRNG